MFDYKLEIDTKKFDQELDKTKANINSIATIISADLDTITKTCNESFSSAKVYVQEFNKELEETKSKTSFFDMSGLVVGISGLILDIASLGVAIASLIFTIMQTGAAAGPASVSLTPLIPVLFGIAAAALAIGVAVKLMEPVLIALIEGIVKIVEIAAPVVMKLIYGIIEVFRILGDIVQSVVVTIGKTIIAVIETIIDGFKFLVDTWREVVSSIGSGVEKVFGFFGKLWDKIRPIFEKIGEFVGGVFKGIANGAIAMVNMVLGVIEKLANAWLLPFNLIIKGLNKIPGVSIGELSVTIPKIPRLDVGTNYVPNDQLAMIHKGEAVIPKKFNNKEFFGKDNDKVVNRLDLLIETLINKDMNAYIGKEEVGKASVGYINNQRRIMGGSVI